jgi:two-component system chemotaxis response regulator CheY
MEFGLPTSNERVTVVLETPCLLITDDDRDFRETLRDVFEPRGYRTILAGDGEQALTIVQKESVHVLLMDMHLPRITGLETIRRVQAFQAALPCILVSAALDDSIMAEAKQTRVFSVLPKPFRSAQITELVRRAMHEAYGWTG